MLKYNVCHILNIIIIIIIIITIIIIIIIIIIITRHIYMHITFICTFI